MYQHRGTQNDRIALICADCNTFFSSIELRIYSNFRWEEYKKMRARETEAIALLIRMCKWMTWIVCSSFAILHWNSFRTLYCLIRQLYNVYRLQANFPFVEWVTFAYFLDEFSFYTYHTYSCFQMMKQKIGLCKYLYLRLCSNNETKLKKECSSKFHLRFSINSWKVTIVCFFIPYLFIAPMQGANCDQNAYMYVSLRGKKCQN